MGNTVSKCVSANSAPATSPRVNNNNSNNNNQHNNNSNSNSTSSNSWQGFDDSDFPPELLQRMKALKAKSRKKRCRRWKTQAEAAENGGEKPSTFANSVWSWASAFHLLLRYSLNSQSIQPIHEEEEEDSPRQVAAYDGPEDRPVDEILVALVPHNLEDLLLGGGNPGQDQDQDQDQDQGENDHGKAFDCVSITSKDDVEKGDGGNCCGFSKASASVSGKKPSKLTTITKKNGQRPCEAIIWLTDNTSSPNYQGNHDYSDIDEEDELENEESGNQGNQFADDPRFTTFLLKVIDSDRLPVMLFEVQELDEALMASFPEDLVDEDEGEGEGEGDHKPRHPRRHHHRRDKDHYGIPVSAFVKVLLTEEEGDGSPRHFQANSGFLASATTGQLLKVRLADEAYFLSYDFVKPMKKKKKNQDLNPLEKRERENYYEKVVDLELVELKRKELKKMEKKEKEKGKGMKGNRSESAEIITLKELCRQKESKGPAAKELAYLSGSSSIPPPKLSPKFVSIKIKEPEVDKAKDNGSSSSSASASPQPERIAHRYRLSTRDVAIQAVPFGELLQEGVIHVRSPKKGRIVLHFARWLRTEKHLPKLETDLFRNDHSNGDYGGSSSSSGNE
ncbi:hypothetical protein TYRP_002948 [Tyrophagus putrescentiae]|nr:hypothetical protein TYRP_002948 [Tyrophagus putrescentiae]